MARTKATARFSGKGPGIAAKAAGKPRKGGVGKAAGKPRKGGVPSEARSKHPRKGKPVSLLQQKSRRFKQSTSVLREIRKAQKAVCFAIPKAPFQRVVREICDSWNLNYRWKRTAILALQEMAEDYLMKFFEDAMLVAAHAHRVTLMAKDINTLSRVRWRYDKLLHPVDWQDLKMRDILLIPPARKSKNDEVKVVEVTHDKCTRGKAAYEEALTSQMRASKSSVVADTEQKELQIQKRLLELGPDVLVKINEETFNLSKVCLLALANRNEYVSDSLIIAILNMFKTSLDHCVQHTVHIIDSAICARLRDAKEVPEDLAKWFTFCNFEDLDVLLLPYHNRDHWSLVSIDLREKQCFLINSLSHTHKELNFCIRRLLDALDCCIPNVNLLDSIEPVDLEAPQQDDSNSCGWRLLIHAKYMLRSYFDLHQPEIMNKDSFGSDYVYSFRADTILKLLSHAASKPAVHSTFELGDSCKEHAGVIHADAGDLDEKKTEAHGDAGIVEENVVEQEQQTKVEEASAGQEQLS